MPSPDDLSEAQRQCLDELTWEFIQNMAVNGCQYLVIRASPGQPHVSFGKSLMPMAADVLRSCIAVIEAEAKKHTRTVN